MRDEPQEAASADLLLADAFAPDEGESEALRRSGITMAWLAAGPMSIVGARAALVQPSASGSARISDADHGLCASLTKASSQPERAPTSVPARAALIASVASELPDARPLRIRFDDAGSARVAAGVLVAGGGGILVGLPASEEGLAELATEGAAADLPRGQQPPHVLCLSGLGPSSSMEQLRLAGESVRQVPFVLGTGNSAAGPRTLRWAAAALVAQGAPPDRVLSALTRDAARAASAGRRGVIEPGATADLVLWSGDPLSPASRVLRAWVSGEQVHVEK